MNLRAKLYFILIFLFSISTYSQQYNFTNLSLDQGLVQSQVNIVFEDSRGYLWIGTNGGISFYNGITFTNFTKNEGLESDEIYSVFEDSKGIIWIGFKNSGLCFYNGEKFITPKLPKELENETITSFTEDKKNNLWIGTEHNGIYIYRNKKIYKVNIAIGENEVSINALFSDKKGNIWIGSKNNGIFLYTDKIISTITSKNGLCNNNITGFSENIDSSIWVSTKYGISNIKNGKIKNYYKSDGLCANNLSDIDCDLDGNIWVASVNYGITKITNNNFISYNKNKGLGNNNIQSIEIDRTNNLWLGTNKGGIYKFDNEMFMHITEKDGLSNNIVMTILEAKDNSFWYGTYGDGVCNYNGKTFRNYNTKNGLCSNVIYCSLQDSKGNIWFGSKGNGVSKFDGKKFTNYSKTNGLASDMVYSILEDKYGNIWFGTFGGGISILRDNKFTHIGIEQGLSSNYIQYLLEDNEGNIFVGTNDSGVDMIFARLNSNTLIKQKYIDKNNILNISKKLGLTNNNIISICKNKTNTIWFGTLGGGICTFNGKTISTITKDDGLNSNNIYSLLYDSRGYLWATSEKGLNRIQFSVDSYHIKKYSKEEGFTGIESNINAAIEDKRGFLWFATIKGISRYNYKEDLPNLVEPNTKITDIKLMSDNVEWDTESSMTKIKSIPSDFSLPSDENNLTFNFIGVDLKSPDKVKYSWKLEGFDKEWRSSNSNKGEITYSYIPNGTYTFKVKACNNDGIWNEKPAISHFTIRPPIWFTWWFLISSIAVSMALVIIYVKIRQRKLEREKEKLEGIIEERTALLKKEKEIVEEKTDELQEQKNVLESTNKKLEVLNNELEKLSIVAKGTDNSVMITDHNGDLIWVNKAFNKLYGYSLDDFIVKKGRNLIETSSNPAIKRIVEKCIEKKESATYISKNKNINGDRIWLQTSLTPIFETETNKLKQIVAIDIDITKIKNAELEIQLEKDKSDNLLLNILPARTANELKAKGTAKPRFYKKTSVLFTDFVGFTKTCENLTPTELVNELHTYFVKFDEITEKYFIEKIKTIGDAYMCVGGLPIRNNSHAIDTVLAALEIQAFAAELNEQKIKEGLPVWCLRIGIHTGEVVAGVVGKKKFAYDIWGDSVNIASRMESSGAAGKVNISETTYEIIKDYFDFEARGMIEAKNKGKINMYFVTGIKEELCENKEKRLFPNDKFRKIISQF